MRLLDIENLCKTRKISSNRIRNLIKTTEFTKVDWSSVVCEADEENDILLEEIYNYDDIYNTIPSELNKKTEMHIYKDKKNRKQYMLCFRPSEELSRYKSIRQILADVSTSHIIQGLSDKEYESFVHHFYTPTNVLVTEYARIQKLTVPDQVCFLYKGGNLFKILLNNVISLLKSDIDLYKKYESMLGRSDADFQLYINPNIPNYDTVFKELSILILISLYSFRSFILSDKSPIDVSKVNLESLHRKFNDILESARENGKVMLKKRKDFILQPIDIDKVQYVMYKSVPRLLENYPKPKETSVYISRNTAIKFKRKDDTYNAFDLLRMKLNIILKIGNVNLSVPSELIDVGIPKSNDNTITYLNKNSGKCLVKYHYPKFDFWGPNLQYMIKDIDAILFYQNDFPWHDKKIQKRIQRYFLSLFLNAIINYDNDPVLSMNSFKIELLKLTKFLVCFNKNIECEVYGDENISNIFNAKYKKIFKKLNMIKDKKKLLKELKDFKEFNDVMIKVIKDLVEVIKHIIVNIPKSKIDEIKRKVKLLHFAQVI